MNKRILLCFAICCSLSAFSQDKAEQPEKPVEFKLSGFIMNNMFFDTRRNIDALDGQVLLFPTSQKKDSMGGDLNKVQNLSLLSFASRLRLGIAGPDAFGSKTSGLIEFDFTARANTASVRFRQAWVKLNWEKTELLVGRTWHPIASIDVVPSVMALSIGAPFQPFNRSEQITLTRKSGKLNLIFSAIFQNDYVNNGPSDKGLSEKTFLYQTNAIIPNLHAQLKYKSDNAIFGIGLDYKMLKPRTSVTSPLDTMIRSTNAHVNCAALLVYGQVKSGKLTLSGKSILASNISENLMTGAYGISSYDTLTGHEEYTPFKHFYVWGNISYGNKVKISLFGGYLKNLGASKNIVDPKTYGLPATVFGLGETIGQMVRIAPTVSYTSGKSSVALEVEHNIATYGVINYSDKGKIINGKNVSGTRVLVTMYYNF